MQPHLHHTQWHLTKILFPAPVGGWGSVYVTDKATEMSDASLHNVTHENEAQFGDYFALLKPRYDVGGVHSLCWVVGSPRFGPSVCRITAILFIALGGGASGALNMWYDADIDAVMRRTKKRPIPAGKVTADEAKAFGIALSGISVVMLGLATNWYAADCWRLRFSSML